MPKLQEIENQIPALYRAKAINMLMFGYVRGARATLPTVTIKMAIDMFMKDFGLSDDDFNRDTAEKTFNDTQKQLIKSL